MTSCDVFWGREMEALRAAVLALDCWNSRAAAQSQTAEGMFSFALQKNRSETVY